MHSGLALPEVFFHLPTVSLATALLGNVLIHHEAAGLCAGRIVETEAYIAPEDEACHAYRGVTPRNRTMFGAPGHAYVYFTYGHHFMLNVVAEREGIAAAVLIRAVEPIEGLETMRLRRPGITRDYDLCNGPGKVTAAFGITRAFDGVRLYSPPSSSLYLAEGKGIKPQEIGVSSRVGISRSVDLPWRFFITKNPYVSKGRPSGSDGKKGQPR